MYYFFCVPIRSRGMDAIYKLFLCGRASLYRICREKVYKKEKPRIAYGVILFLKTCDLTITNYNLNSLLNPSTCFLSMDS